MQLSKFKSILESEKEAIMSQIALSNQKEVDSSGDEIDQIQARILAHSESQLVARNQLKLLKVDAALKRIEEGKFGVCGSCEEEIELKRLLFSPIINLCISCAEKSEILKKQMS